MSESSRFESQSDEEKIDLGEIDLEDLDSIQDERAVVDANGEAQPPADLDSIREFAEAQVAEHRRFRSWFGTLNNPHLYGCEDPEGDFRELCLAARVEYACYCLEEGENGTPHIQFVLVFPHPKGFGGVSRLFQHCWLAPRKADCLQKAVDYIKHTGKHAEKPGLLEGPWEVGKQPPERGGRGSALHDLVARVMDSHDIGAVLESVDSATAFVRNHRGIQALLGMLQEREPRDPDGPEVIWISGATGTGKTRTVYAENPEEDIAQVTVSGNAQSPFFNGYTGQRVLLLDELRPGAVSLPILLQVLDRYKFMVNTKNGYQRLRAKKVYITGPLTPENFMSTGYPFEDPQQLVRRLTRVIRL